MSVVSASTIFTRPSKFEAVLTKPAPSRSR